MKASNVTGERFGMLLAIKRVGSDNYKRAVWQFSCDCGNLTEASLNNVKSGTTKSCGCLKSVPRKRLDLAGKKFGRLTVESYFSTENGKARWLCSCVCGKKSITTSMHLTRGKTKSCGCLQIESRYRPNKPIGSQKWARIVKSVQVCCANCGSSENLNAHHIKPVSTNMNLEKDFSNGVSLCRRCHTDFHLRYGKYHHGSSELSDFLQLGRGAEKVLSLFVGWREQAGLQSLVEARKVLASLIDGSAA